MTRPRPARNPAPRLAARGIAIAALALASALAGCASNEVVDPLAGPALAEQAARPPLPLRVLIAPLEDARASSADAASAPTATASPEESDLARAPVPGVDAEALRGEVRAALEKARTAQAVLLSPGDMASPEALLAAAYERPLREHVLLRLRLLRYDVTYRDGDMYPATYALRIASTLCMYWPHWWVAAEDYECAIALEAEAVSVASERTVLRRVYRASERRTLSEWERGLSIGGPILYGTISLDDNHWAQAAAFVAPPAREKVLAELARDLKALDPDGASLAGAHLVAAGPGVFDAERLHGRALLQAEKDVGALAELLVGTGVVPRKNAQVLLAGRATKREILDRLARASGAARPSETVTFAFAGFGACAGSRPLLVPSDFDPARPLETGITVEDLSKALEGPSRQAVLIDASFAGAGRPLVRTLATGDAEQAPDAAALERAFQALRREGRVVVLSAGASGWARSGERLGLFTGFLLEAARSRETKPDAEGIVTLNAVFERVRRSTRSATDDPPQEPLWIGAAGGPQDPKEVRIALLRVDASPDAAKGAGGAGGEGLAPRPRKMR